MAETSASQIDLATTADFMIGGTQVRPSLREIQSGEAIETLEPRVMQVLVLLAEMEGRPVSRDLMVDRCWGSVFVGDDAIQRCIGRLRKLADTTGAFEIGTVRRVGYRLIVKGASRFEKPVHIGLDRSIAVLDFRSAERAGADAIFAESLADDICAALAVNSEMRVVARAVAATVAEGASDPVSIGAALNVRYTTSGTIRPSNAGRRITIQLFATETGEILWSHQRDVPVSDNYPSDELLIDLAGRLIVHMIKDEEHRAMQKSSDITAWEAVVRSVSAYRRISLENLPFAVAEARRAVGLAPHYGAAHAALANALAATFEVGGGIDISTAREAETHCELAMALDPTNPTVLASTGNALGMIGLGEQGYPLLERAVELAPTHTSAHLYLARALLRQQRPEDALKALGEHDRIAPQCQWHYFVHYYRSLGHFMAGRHKEAEEALDRSIIINPNYPYAWLSKAVLLMALGRPHEASDAAEKLRRLEGANSLPLQLNRIANGYPHRETAVALQSFLSAAWKGAEGVAEP